MSLTTGGASADALEGAGHEVARIDVGPDLAQHLAGAAPEKVFIALHGRWGEDGT